LEPMSPVPPMTTIFVMLNLPRVLLTGKGLLLGDVAGSIAAGDVTMWSAEKRTRRRRESMQQRRRDSTRRPQQGPPPPGRGAALGRPSPGASSMSLTAPSQSTAAGLEVTQRRRMAMRPAPGPAVHSRTKVSKSRVHLTLRPGPGPMPLMARGAEVLTPSLWTRTASTGQLATGINSWSSI
jgi:hypothetical protein